MLELNAAIHFLSLPGFQAREHNEGVVLWASVACMILGKDA